MSRTKRYDLVSGLADPELAEQLDPLHSPEPDVREPEVTALNEEMGEFLEDAGRSVNKFDLRSGFYTGSEESTPRHVVDQEDLDRHRTGHFHVHHPMSIYSGQSGSSKGRHGKGSSKGGKHHKRKHKTRKPRSPQFQPSMEGVQETASYSEQSENEEDGHPEVFHDEEVFPSSSKTEPESPAVPGPQEEPPGPSGVGLQPDGVDGEKPVFFLPESSDSAIVSLHDVMVGETSTDPDPGKGSVDARRGRFSHSEDYGKTSSQKVTFVLGEPATEDGEEEAHPEDSEKPERPAGKKDGHHHHHHHHHRHGHSVPSLASRRRPGSEISMKLPLHRVPTEQDEANMLSGVDLDDMTSHRLGESRGVRRRKMSTVPSQKKKLAAPSRTLSRPGIDHSPHELFVELAELHQDSNEEYEWQETARWIKYEEDAEADSTRFGKPHVASLSFHSLLELRQVLAQGVVLMDLDGEDLATIVDHIVDKMVIADQLSAENKGSVMKALMLKHRHVNEGGFLRRNSTAFNLLSHDKTGSGSSFRNLANFFGGSRSHATPKGSGPLHDKENNEIEFGLEQGESNGFTGVSVDGKTTPLPEIKIIPSSSKNQNDHVKIDLSESGSLASNPSEQNLPAYGDHSNILKRIPKGAEVTSVLVGSVDFLDQPIMAFVRLSKGCMLGNFTEVPLPVRFLFILMGPSSNTMDYHEIGRSISTLMTNRHFHDVAYQAEERKELLNAINEFLDESIVLPPGKWDKKTLLPIMDMAKEKARQRQLKEKIPPPVKEDDGFGDPLQRTGRPFGGMINDVRRRYPKYWSDIKDGLNLQCLATFFFIYFACLSPAITFGGLLGEKTFGLMGVSELLIMTSIAGIVFALLSAQPLLIVGFTGPIIVFEEGLYQFCGSVGLDYMGFRVWICLWVWLIALLVVCFEGSFFVRYFTRFTMEIFAALISLIFIYEVFYKLYKVFQQHPLQSHSPTTAPLLDASSNLTTNITDITTISFMTSSIEDNINTTEVPAVIAEKINPVGEPNTALLSLILTLGTFFIAYFLKQFRNSKFLGRSVRRALGDFGIPIAIVVMVLIDFLIEETFTQKLDVPGGVKPTRSDLRGWFINPLGLQKKLPIWAYFAAVLPAMLVFILIFMESQITGMIISKKTKKGTGFHLDLMLIGSFSIISGFLGMPLLTVATVRSVSHVSALSVMSRTHAPGEKPKLIEVKEQRLTGIAVHIMIGVSVLLSPVLKQVPLAVLFGVFLYMGVASMSGVQLFDRAEMLFMPRKHHPDVGYVKKVKTSKMHLYTLLQLVCLAVLWVVKSTKAALAFPFFLVIMVPIRRHLLTRVFLPKELLYLDKDDDDDGYDSDDDEPDFYTQAHMPM